MNNSTRREFLHNGLTFVSLGIAMPSFLMQAAQAQASTIQAAPSGGPASKVLVVVEFNGGNDGLNTVIPHLDPQYQKLRPSIGILKGAGVGIDNNLVLHPQMKSFSELYEKGRLAVISGVGYPNPNQSHFESMDIWQLADPAHQMKERVGWMARYFDEDGHLKSNPLSGISLAGLLPLAMSGDAASVLSLGQENPFSSDNDNERKAKVAARTAMYEAGTVANSHADFIRKVGHNAYSNTGQIKQALKNFDDKANKTARYPDSDFARTLQSVSKLITGGLPTKVYYVQVGGFDTHSNQPEQHGRLLGSIADAIAAFYRDLDLQGRGNDVALMSFSEFGRRAQENGSAGTDHGAASVMFVAGGGIKGGVHGAYPSLTDLDDGNLRYTTDFRSVYANMIDGFLGADSNKVLGGKFKPIGLV